jgi:putative endonuclease
MTKAPARPTARRQLGTAGEELAARHLEAQGLTVITRNWRCAAGELDLIAEEVAPDYVHGGVQVPWRVLVEVRTRRGDAFGTALQSVTERKAAKLREVGEHYVLACGWAGPWRIDVVAVQMDAGGRLLRVEHIRHAVGG